MSSLFVMLETQVTRSEDSKKYPCIAHFADYRAFLQAVYEDLVRKNPRFSVRAFAKRIELSPPMVLALFNRSRGLSLDRLVHVGRCLQLGRLEQKYLKLLFERSLMKSETDTNQIDLALHQLADYLSEDREEAVLEFDFIPGWHHRALFEWTLRAGTLTLKELTEVGERFGMNAQSARDAIEQLVRANLLRSGVEQEGSIVSTPRDSAQLMRARKRLACLSLLEFQALGL